MKATITIEDGLRDGQIHLSCEFDPEITNDTDSMAAYSALHLVQCFQAYMKEMKK